MSDEATTDGDFGFWFFIVSAVVLFAAIKYIPVVDVAAFGTFPAQSFSYGDLQHYPYLLSEAGAAGALAIYAYTKYARCRWPWLLRTGKILFCAWFVVCAIVFVRRLVFDTGYLVAQHYYIEQAGVAAWVLQPREEVRSVADQVALHCSLGTLRVCALFLFFAVAGVAYLNADFTVQTSAKESSNE